MNNFFLVLGLLLMTLVQISPSVSLEVPRAIQGTLVQSPSESELGLDLYPQSRSLPDADARLMREKASSWLLARAFHSDDSLKSVLKYFKAQAEKRGSPPTAGLLLRALLHDNWKSGDSSPSGASSLFGAGKELRKDTSRKLVEASFGVIVLDDSIVRVHLMSPYPSPADDNKLIAGTMIVLIRERLDEQSALSVNVDSDQERVYAVRDVTQRARIKSRPEPDYTNPGISGTVVLRAVLSSSGKVTKIRVLAMLPGGLTEESIKAASKIKFDPAVKDGRFVAQHVQLEYSFHR